MTSVFAMPPAISLTLSLPRSDLPGGGFFMRSNNLENIPFPTKKKLKKNKTDFRSATFANNRRDTGRMPTRQFNRGR
ncbi:hypothetical protein ABT299_16375 [Spirillospora sp. NPDC000708]